MASNSRIRVHLSGFFEKIFRTRCRGVFPSESYLLRSAFLSIKDYMICILSLTTAKCTGLPKMPPPKLTSAPPSIRLWAAS